MNKRRISNYNYFLLNIAAYLTVVAVAITTIEDMRNLSGRWLVAGLFIAFGGLITCFPFLEQRPLLVHAYLATQFLFILGIFLVDPLHNLDVQILFQ
ncbi:MAG: hypothetical protein L0346_00085 [Chloroflexi bacterium]|nr:hypothetical protein [Chloroflexota bacterium]